MARLSSAAESQLELVVRRQRGQIQRQQDEINQLRIQVARLRGERDDREGATLLIPLTYASSLCALWHVAHFALPPHSPANAELPPPRPGSKPPIYDPFVYRKLTREGAHLTKRGNDIREWLAHYDDGALGQYAKMVSEFERDQAAT